MEDLEEDSYVKSTTLFRNHIHLKSAITDHDLKMIEALINGNRVSCPDLEYYSAAVLKHLMDKCKIQSISVEGPFLYHRFSESSYTGDCNFRPKRTDVSKTA